MDSWVPEVGMEGAFCVPEQLETFQYVVSQLNIEVGTCVPYRGHPFLQRVTV